jgi:thiol-disulfide isomerase/thioredoxin
MPITQKRKRGKPNRSSTKASKRTTNKRRSSKMHKTHNVLPEQPVDEVHEAPVLIGLIYANWCHHCQALKPAWEEMKKDIKNKYNGQFTVVEIEADQPDKSEQLAKLEQMLDGEKIDASGYPTIVKVGGGRVDYYGGNREMHDMLNWATGQDNEHHTGGFQKEKHLNKRSRSRKHTPISK